VNLRPLPAALSAAITRLEREVAEADPSVAPLVIGELERIKTALLIHSMMPKPAPNGHAPQSPNLTGDEASAYLRMKRSRLDELRRKGKVRAMRSGKEYVYRREHLDELQASMTNGLTIIQG
jgi:hypothetical protein